MMGQDANETILAATKSVSLSISGGIERAEQRVAIGKAVDGKSMGR
jgi:hypothetical protein